MGRASAASCELLDTGTWYSSFCDNVDNASEVELASYLYDNATVQKVLLKRLRGRTAFSLNVYVDGEQLNAGVCTRGKGRLRDLRTAGALVYICRGRGIL